MDSPSQHGCTHFDTSFHGRVIFCAFCAALLCCCCCLENLQKEDSRHAIYVQIKLSHLLAFQNLFRNKIGTSSILSVRLGFAYLGGWGGGGVKLKLDYKIGYEK